MILGAALFSHTFIFIDFWRGLMIAKNGLVPQTYTELAWGMGITLATLGCIFVGLFIFIVFGLFGRWTAPPPPLTAEEKKAGKLQFYKDVCDAGGIPLVDLIDELEHLDPSTRFAWIDWGSVDADGKTQRKTFNVKL